MVASSRNESKQQREELAVFDDFASLSGLDVQSCVKRDPPAPDLLATFKDNSTVAFELLELSDESLKWKHGAHDRNCALLQTAVNEKGDSRLEGKYIDIRIREYAKKAEVSSVTLDIIAILNSLPADYEGDLPQELFTRVRPTVLSMRVQEMGLNGPVVTLGPISSRTDSETASCNPVPKGWDNLAINYQKNIERKTRKQYGSAAPIELLAWCGVWGSAHASICWLPQLEDSLKSRCDFGPFRKIWVVNLLFDKRVLLSISH